MGLLLKFHKKWLNVLMGAGKTKKILTGNRILEMDGLRL